MAVNLGARVTLHWECGNDQTSSKAVEQIYVLRIKRGYNTYIFTILCPICFNPMSGLQIYFCLYHRFSCMPLPAIDLSLVPRPLHQIVKLYKGLSKSPGLAEGPNLIQWCLQVDRCLLSYNLPPSMSMKSMLLWKSNDKTNSKQTQKSSLGRLGANRPRLLFHFCRCTETYCIAYWNQPCTCLVHLKYSSHNISCTHLLAPRCRQITNMKENRNNSLFGYHRHEHRIDTF